MSDSLLNPGHDEMSQGGRWSRESQEKGNCARCRRPKFGDHSLCRGHLVRARMHQWGNSRPECKQYRPSGGRGRQGGDPLFDLAEQMLKKLEEQGNKCAVTGEPIDLGTNAQLDHIVGVPERPDLAYEPSNLRWVSQKTNQSFLRRTGAQSRQESKDPRFRIAYALGRVLAQTSKYELEDSAHAEKWSHLRRDMEALQKELQSD